MLKVENIKLIQKGPLVCKFDIHISEWGLTIRECTFFKKGDKRWISMPQKVYEKDGEKNYFPYVFWTKEMKAKLDEKVLDLLKAQVDE